MLEASEPYQYAVNRSTVFPLLVRNKGALKIAMLAHWRGKTKTLGLEEGNDCAVESPLAYCLLAHVR